MKLTATILTILTATASATPWCYKYPGRACWKREPNQDIVVPRNSVSWCSQLPGDVCSKAKRTIESMSFDSSNIPDLPKFNSSNHVYSQDEAESVAYIAELALHDLAQLATQAHPNSEQFIESLSTDSRYLHPASEKRGYVYPHIFCPLRNCWWKRDGNPTGEAFEQAGDTKRWLCQLKENEPLPEVCLQFQTPINPNPEETKATHLEQKRWCHIYPGRACWKLKRAAETFLAVANEESNGQPEARFWNRCDTSNAACLVAKDRMDAIQNKARSILSIF